MRYIQHIGKYGVCVILCFFLLYPTDTKAKQEPLQLENQQEVRLKIVSEDEGGGGGNENQGGNDEGEEIIPDGQGDGSLNESGNQGSNPSVDINLPSESSAGLKPIKGGGDFNQLKGYENADSAPLPQTGIENSFYTFIGVVIMISLVIWQIRTRMRKRYE